jgi:aryl-alcohol dehydrogenase-like predicted oxidoreductase
VKSRHPGLSLALGKLQRNESLTEEELQRLQRQLDQLEGRTSRERKEPLVVEPHTAEEPRRAIPGHATRKGGERLAARSGTKARDFYRAAQDLIVSSVGIGTYRGAIDRETDVAYTHAVHAALRAGVNLIDTSINYRYQRSELSVAAGLQRFLEKDGGRRDEVVICTKGGYLVPGAVTEDTVTAEDVAGGIHCIAPGFLADQVERSRRNLGIETIDVYYLHNPETQLGFVDPPKFLNRVRGAFARLETAVSDGFIRYYGTATWEGGYLVDGLSLRSLAEIAREIAGDSHHFRFIQLPVSLGTPRALMFPAQGGGNVLDLAAELGITVIASASLLGGRLARDLPEEITQILSGFDSDAQRAIQFTRSTPGITTALVGMRQAEHVAENLAVARVAGLDTAAYERLQCVLRE